MTLEELGYKLIEKDGKYYYNGDLYFGMGSNITSLPDNLVVCGSLYLRNNTKITSLPNNLVVGGGIDLRGTKITSLPDNLVVGRYLDLQETNITFLPDNLTVGGFLYLIRLKLTSLPNNLIVGNDLNLTGTNITSLPDNLVVGGSLDLRWTNITSLPNNLKVSGGIYGNTKITEEDISKISHNVSNVLFWRDKEYIKGDGRPLRRIISNRGNIYEVSEIGDENKIYYFITNESGDKCVIEYNLEIAKKKYNLLNIKK